MCEAATEQPIALKIDYSSKSFLDLHKTFPVFTLIVKKVCTKCDIEKPLEMFSVDINQSSGRRPSCKECHKKYLVTYKLPVGPKTVFFDHPPSKTCTLCGVEKSVQEFCFQKLGKYGRLSVCRVCTGNKGKAFYESRKGTVPFIPEGVDSKICTKCGEELPFSRFTSSPNGRYGLQSWCLKCSGENTKAWELANPKAKVDRERRQLARDPVARLIKRLRSRLRQMVRLMGVTKSVPTIEMVSCSGEECMGKLEAMFWPGMTRENSGSMKWHVDHVIPIESFDKSDPDWQFKAFHWSNLQPLWADDNLAKSYRLDWIPAESVHELPERLKQFAPLQKRS